MLLIRKDLDNIRFQPYVDWMHTASEQDALDLKINYSFSEPPKNSGAHIETRNKLINSVKKYVQNSESIAGKYYLSEQDRLRWHNLVLRDCLEDNLKEYKEDIVAYEKQIKRLERKNKIKPKDNSPVASHHEEEVSLITSFFLNLKLFGIRETMRKVWKKIKKYGRI